jgi:hypothetical protein
MGAERVNGDRGCKSFNTIKQSACHTNRHLAIEPLNSSLKAGAQIAQSGHTTAERQEISAAFGFAQPVKTPHKTPRP